MARVTWAARHGVGVRLRLGLKLRLRLRLRFRLRLRLRLRLGLRLRLRLRDGLARRAPLGSCVRASSCRWSCAAPG